MHDTYQCLSFKEIGRTIDLCPAQVKTTRFSGCMELAKIFVYSVGVPVLTVFFGRDVKQEPPRA